MKSYSFRLPLHGIRSQFLNWGFAKAYPIYKACWAFRRKAWKYSRQQLLSYPPESLGHAIAHFLQQNKLDFIAGFENHDVFHVLLAYDSTAVSETALQWHLLGNGKRSPFCFLAAFSGFILFPEHWGIFHKAYQKGRQQRSFHQWQFAYLLKEPIATLRLLINRQASSIKNQNF